MANKADGSIYIDTKIDTSGFEAGTEKAADASKRLVDSVSKISNTAKTAMQSASQSYNSAVSALERQKKAVTDLENQLLNLKNQKIPTEEYKQLSIEFEKAKQAIAEAKAEYQSMRELGFRGADLQAYVEKWEEAESVLDRIAAKEAEMRKSGTAYIAPDTSAAEERLAAAYERTLSAQSRADYQYSKLIRTASKYAGVSAKLLASDNKLVRVFGRVSVAVGKTASQFKLLLSKGKGLLTTFGKLAKKLTLINRSANGTSYSFATMIKNALLIGLAMRGVMAAFSGIGAGMNNLVQYSDKFNQSVSSMYSALQYLKNALGTTFAPIVNVVAPYITAFINMMAKAATYVGMFFAALTGQDSFVAAVPVAYDYADAISDAANSTADAANATKKAAKENQRYLSGLDEVRRFSEDNANTTGSSSGKAPATNGNGSASDISKMFETVNIPNKISDLAEKIKQAWANADFTGIGTMLGEKLKAGLNSIPWNSIQAVAAKAGTSFATLINGIVEVPSLGYTIGNTIAQAINTGLAALSSFATSLHWDSVGQFIADGINGVCKNIDWASYFTGMSAVGRGIATALNNVITPETFGNIGTTLGKIISGIIESVYQFLKTADFTQYGTALAEGINKAIKNIDFEKLGENLGLLIQSMIDFVSGLVDNLDWKEIAQAIEDFFAGLSEHVDMGKLGASLAGLFALWLGANFITSVGTSVLEKIGKKVTEKIVEKIVLGLGSSGLLGMLSAGASALIGLISTAITTAAAAAAPFIPVVGAIIAAILAVFLIAQNWDKIKEVGGKIIAGIKEGISAAAAGATTFMNEHVIQPLANLFGGLASGAKEKMGDAVTFISDKFGSAKDAVVTAAETMKSKAETGFENIKTAASEKFSSAKESIVNAMSNAQAKAATSIESLKSTAKTKFDTFKQNASTAFTNAKNSIVTAMSGAKSTAGTYIDTLKSNAANKFESIKSTASTAFGKVKDSIGGAFENGAETALNGINRLANGIKKPINAIIGFLNGLIRAAVSAWNNIASVLSFDISIPSVLQKLTGWSRVNLSVPKIKSYPNIPYLASGAVIPQNHEFLAVLGDQKSGTNIETPEKLLRQIMREELGNVSAGGTYQFTAQINRRTLFDEIITEAKLRQQQTGRNPLTAF